jgi:hypothetical protein
MKTKLSISIFILSAVTFQACGGGGGSDAGSGSQLGASRLEVRLTDAPGEFTEVVVTIDGVSVKTTGSAGFVDLPLNMNVGVGGAVVERDLAQERLTINLVALSGSSLRLALGEIPPGAIEQIRLHVVPTVVDGTETPWIVEDVPGAQRERLKVPSGEQSGIKIVPRNVDVASQGLTSITLDWDASKSIVILGNRPNPHRGFDFILKPVIFVLESDSLVRGTTTVATGLNFPEGVAYVDDTIVVANAGTGTTSAASGAGALLVLDAGAYETGTPLDATTPADSTVPAAPPHDVANDEINGGAGAFATVFSETLARYALSDLSTATTDDLVTGATLRAVAPARTPADDGPSWFVATTTDVSYFDPAAGSATSLGIAGLTGVTGLAFLRGTPTGTYGTLVVTDGAANEILAIPLNASGADVTVGAPIVRRTAATLDFMKEPIGVTANVAGTSVYVAMRGNGFVYELSAALDPIRVIDTGLGPDSLNAITAVASPLLDGFTASGEVLLLASTNGVDDPALDDPIASGAGSTIEALTP